MQQLLDRATALHQQGRFSEAERIYRQALAAQPDDPKANYLLALLLYQQGNGAEALASANAILQKMPNFVDALILRGAIVQQENPQQALDDFKAATAHQPGHGDAWYNQGVLLAQLGQYPQAVDAFDRALQIRPGAAAWNNRGSTLLAMGQGEDALASFDRAVALDQGYAAARHNRANALLQLRRSEEALAAFDSFLKLVPDAFEAWHNRGLALQALGRHDQALESYRRSAAIRPDYAPAWKSAGLLLASLSRDGEAVEALTRTLVFSDEAEIWKVQADALCRLSRVGEALVSYEKALALSPEDADIWSEYATALQFNRRFDEALAAVERAMALAPDSPNVLATRGALLCERNNVPEGLASYARLGALVHGRKPQSAAGDPGHKKRHDLEQGTWLAAEGVAAETYHIMGGERLGSRAVNPGNGSTISSQWQSSQPQIVIVDDLLTEEALVALRRFCWGSTVWKQPYPNGYLGAMPEDGFACPLLAQIADELRETFPSIFGAHGLVRIWGFKYDSTLGGINLHADQAAVNVNFWITPDEANRNPENGGLVIWDKSAPLEWEFKRYNAYPEQAREFLVQAGAKPVKVPYRANRAVIFDSDLFHETDTIEFKPGYRNRRINITALYGRRSGDGG